MKLPNEIYKYRTCDQRGLDVLRKQELWLAAPSTLNDPLDCRIPVRYELGTFRQIYDKTLKYLKDKHPEWNRGRVKKVARIKTQYIHHNQKNKELVQSFREEHAKINDQRYGVCSLSSTNLSPVMWSQYAGSHKGLCIGINSIKLEQLLQSQRRIYWLDYVKYPEELPILNPFFDEVQVHLDQIFTKSKHWAYEEEVRLIVAEKPNSRFGPISSIISSVTVGNQISDRNLESIVSIIKSLNTSILLYKTSFLENSFDMELERVLYG